MPPLNRDAAALMRAAVGAPALGSLPPAEMRLAYLESRARLQAAPDRVAQVTDMTIPGPGGALPVRVYRHAEGVLPCLLFLHGGGWVLGNLDSHDSLCRRLALASGGCVVAVDYRLAPEHPFPAALEDGAAALRWVAEHAGRLGIDPVRLAVGGDSAGGNLAAVLALMARDGAVPGCVFQLLLYPVVDFAMDTASYRRVVDGVPLTAGAMAYFAGHYVAEAGRADWRASPLRAVSLAGVAPALVLTCGHDPLCDEGMAYATRLEREGVAVTSVHLSDQVHGLLNMGRVIGAAAGAIDFVAVMLKEAWRKDPP